MCVVRARRRVMDQDEDLTSTCASKVFFPLSKNFIFTPSTVHPCLLYLAFFLFTLSLSFALLNPNREGDSQVIIFMGRPRPEGEEFAGHEHQTASSAKPDHPTVYFDAPVYPPPPAAGVGINEGPQAPNPPPAATGKPASFIPASPPPAAAPSPYQATVGKPWTTGLFDCGENQTNAIMTAFFPCVTFGQIAEILDEGGTSCTLGSFMYVLMVPALLTCWIIGSNYRKKLRNKYNLVEAPSEDWTVHLFCSCCALCQEFRELQHRGIDPSLGWMGYLAQKQYTETQPPVGQFMSK